MSTLEPSMTDIVMITWHRPEITELTIRTIKENTTSPYRLIVVDNFSPQVMSNRLIELHQEGIIHELILNSSNLGLESARNLGLAMVTSDLFVCADNDCLPMPPDDGGDWLTKLNRLMDMHPDYAAISARTQVMIGTGNIFEEHEDEDIVDFPHPGGSLRIMRTDLVRQVGGWRNEEPGRGTEERYIGGKLREAGYKTAFAVQVRCLHLFGDRTKGTDRWGYPEDWTPEMTGHSDIWHPALTNGDDPDEIKKYTSN